MDMMKPKMMAMMNNMKAGRRGKLMKAMVEDMREDEHEAMMKATMEDMMEVMRTDMKTKMRRAAVMEMTKEWRAVKEDEQETMMVAMLADERVRMDMMKPKMMAIKNNMKAGGKGQMMKAM